MIRSCFIMVFAFFTYHFSFSQYTIPWATQQPAWVFPIWFEDGTGQRDTVYLGYDPNANSSWDDTIFGEKKVIRDTTKFSVFFGGWNYPIYDTVMKVFISKDLPGHSLILSSRKIPIKDEI